MCGLLYHIKLYDELWHTACACGIKNTQLLLSTSREAASWKNAHTGSITLQENLLAVIRTDLCARCTGFPQLHQVFGAMSTSMHTTNLCIKQLRT